MKIHVNKDFINSIAVFLVIFLTSSFVVTNNIISSAMTIVLWLFLIGVLFLYSRMVRFDIVIPIGILASILIINTLINGENIRNGLLFLFTYMVVLLYVSEFNVEEFSNKYCDIIYVLAWISIIGWGMYLLIPQLKGMFTVINNANNMYSCLVIYAYPTSGGIRNYGMFWEPGAYQTFLNLALLFEFLRKDMRLKRIIILIFTIATTYSTTGYLAAILIVFVFYLKKGTNKKVKRWMTLFVVLALVLAYFNSDYLFGKTLSTGHSTVFGKIINFLNSNNRGHGMTSADIRYNAIFEVLKAFLERPVIGYGYQGLVERTKEYTHGMNTCTFLNYFAVYGLLYGTISILGFYRFTKKISNERIVYFGIFVVLFVITMSENYVTNAFFLILIMLGWKKYRIESSEIEENESRRN